MSSAPALQQAIGLVRSTSLGVLALGAVACGAVACGGPVTSGIAVGRAGQQLVAHAQAAPQGAEVCALQEAVAPPPPQGSEKPVSASCAKAFKSDQLWRRAMVVLGAYGESLAAVSTTKSSEGVGQLGAASTGVRGADWLNVDDAGEKGARDAVVTLVNQMSANAAKGDPAKVVNEAAPAVKTLCDGLGAYLEAQTKSLGDVEKEIEKKRASRTERRCGALDSKTLCVSETSIDRVTYGSTYAHVVMLENNHVEAYNAVGGFCAAHRKLEEAAAAGRLSKDATYAEIVEAVRSARRLSPAAPPVVAQEAPATPKK